jgi:hypothetical protein
MISHPTLVLLKDFLEKQVVGEQKYNTPLYDAYLEIAKHLEEKQQKETAKAAIPFVLRKDRLNSGS